MSMDKFLLGVLAVVFCAGAGICFGGTITVSKDGSADYTTIQAAIDAAEPNDTVIVYTKQSWLFLFCYNF